MHPKEHNKSKADTTDRSMDLGVTCMDMNQASPDSVILSQNSEVYRNLLSMGSAKSNYTGASNVMVGEGKENTAMNRANAKPAIVSILKKKDTKPNANNGSESFPDSYFIVTQNSIVQEREMPVWTDQMRLILL